MDADAFDFTTAWMFIYPGKRPARLRPTVKGDVRQGGEGWYYGMQTFPEGTDEDPADSLAEGPFPSRGIALDALYSDTLDWFSGEGHDQSKVPLPRSFLRALNGEELARDDDEDEEEED